MLNTRNNAKLLLKPFKKTTFEKIGLRRYLSDNGARKRTHVWGKAIKRRFVYYRDSNLPFALPQTWVVERLEHHNIIINIKSQIFLSKSMI